MYRIPLFDAPHQKFITTLDGGQYQLELMWNTRGEYWVMNIYTYEGTPLVTGIRLSISYELIRQYRGIELPPGAMYLYREAAPYVEVDRETLLDGTVDLIYVTEAEWESGVRMGTNGTVIQ